MKKLVPILAMFILFGCNTKTNVVTVTDDSRGSTSSGGSSGGSYDDDDDDGSVVPIKRGCTAEGTARGDTYGTMPYYRFQVVSRGDNTVNTGEHTLAWRSSDFAYVNNKCVTDSNLRLRVMAYPSPGQGNDSYGTYCKYLAWDYTMLEITVGIKKKGAADYSDLKVFQNVKVNDCSEIWQPSTIPYNDTSAPYVIEVAEVRWSNSQTSNYSLGQVNPYDCVKFEIQMETDQTVIMPDK